MTFQDGRDDKWEKWLIAHVLQLSDLALLLLHNDIVSEAWMKWM